MNSCISLKMDKKQVLQKILFFFFLFIIFHQLSFLGYLYPLLGRIVFCLIVAAVFIVTYLNQDYGWLFLIFEFFSGHGGHLFEWGLSLRLAIFVIVFGFWLWRKRKHITSLLDKNRTFFIPLLVFFVFVVFGFLQGLINNNPHLAIGDFVNYSYWLLVFPLFEFFKHRKNQENFFAIAVGCLFGISFLTLIVFILFSQGVVGVHGIFYWWWRKIVIGKATDMGNNFFRIVTPAHLIVLPIFLLVISLYSEFKKSKIIGLLAFSLSFPFLINFSRVYWLGFLAGLFFLGFRRPIKRYLKVSFLVLILLIIEFGAIYFIASQGRSFGLDFFGSRLGTTVAPEEELSALTRLRILPNLIQDIAKRPIFGKGLGTEVSYVSPLDRGMRETYHIDWGFFEMWLELGFLGLIAFLVVLGEIIYLLWKIKDRFSLGLLSGVLSLIIASLTGPFVFHSLGVFYLVLAFIYGAKNFGSNHCLSEP